jgi:hypothetical protein
MPKRSSLLLAFVLVPLLASACGHHRDPAGGASSGIEGQVLIGPRCPVERADSPCPDQPIAALVSFKDPAGKFLGPARAGDDGRFRIDLSPGTYTVLAHEISDNPRIARPRAVTVEPGAFASITLVIDSGIR